MGDLRNKLNKEIEIERTQRSYEAWARRSGAPNKPQPAIACQVCQRDYFQVTIYAIDQGHWRPALFLCEEHLRPEDRAEMGR